MSWPSSSPRRKYRNVPTVVDGIRFPSKRQASRYLTLKLREQAGEIVDLVCERPYDLVVNGTKVCRYVADFVYAEVVKTRPNAITYEPVVEDSKGVRTPVYKLKKKLMRALHGVEILET